MQGGRRKYTFVGDSASQFREYNVDRASCCSSSTSYPHDDWDGPGWYRVRYQAGTKLSTHAFTKYTQGECATHVGGWVTGDHPTVAYTTVTRRVRFDRPGHPSTWWNHDISITKCDGFFVYYLPGVARKPATPGGGILRYCTQ